MKNIRQVLCDFSKQCRSKCWAIGMFFFLFQVNAFGQTFEFPSALFVDSISLKDVLKTLGNDTVVVHHDAFTSMSNGVTQNFQFKSLLAVTNYKVDVQSSKVGKHRKFTYMITYKTLGVINPLNPTVVDPTPVGLTDFDTLTISYDGDSLKLINDRTFRIAGARGGYHKLSVVIQDVIEITNSGGGLSYQLLTPGIDTNVPEFVHIYGELYVQKFFNHSSLSMNTIVNTDKINVDGTVLLDWSAGLPDVTPAGYEVEWTYVSPHGPQAYDFRNNATRVFTNNTHYSIPVAERQGTLVYRARMVRPTLGDLLTRKYGDWSLQNDQGSLSSTNSKVDIQLTSHDSLNWDLKMSFVEDGKYKQVMTYYDGLLKPKQVQTRFNSNPSQTIVAQSLYDYEGRAVINSLPIPVNGISKFSYLSNFLRPSTASEYTKSMYDAIPNPNICPPKETSILPLDVNALSNQYFSVNNSNKSGKNAFIPDAEGYPLVRKVIAAENNEKVLFEGKAGFALQLGHDRHMEYLYGAPLQAELNRYFGQDIGKYNYYRKMITTDNHDQDMFSVTDNEGKIVASGLIGTPDTNNLALSVRNSPVKDSFHSNLLPVPNIKIGDHWRNNGSYFVERVANYGFKYQLDYNPYRPCSSINVGLLPKIYFDYEVIDPCGNSVLQYSGQLGSIGTTTAPSITHTDENASVHLEKGNHVWKKHSYIMMDDLRASVDAYLDSGYECFTSFDHYLKQAFLDANFPCVSRYDPCASMRFTMMKEMYPGAKYGSYAYTDSLSKRYTGPGTNSIFSIDAGNSLLYQNSCIPDYIDCGDTTYYIKDIAHQTMIDIFNDSIAAKLLPLHPDYCKLLLCPVLNNPYCKKLLSIKKASEAMRINRYQLDDIANADPLFTNSMLTTAELSRTLDDDLPIDSIAFKRTICGSEFGIIESVCADINLTKNPNDISLYPEYMQDEYYRKLIELYNDNRESRIAILLQQSSSSCTPCSTKRLSDGSTPAFATESDTSFLVGGVDSMTDHLNLPVNSSFDDFINNSSSVDANDLNSLKNADNSVYCTEVVESIVNTLSSCNVSQAKLTELHDTLKNRFCVNNNSIASMSYDSLTNILGDVGIATNDLCNAGLIDLRKITRKSYDFVQLGLLHYEPAYYEDFLNLLSSNTVLSFIAGSADSMNISLGLCDNHPFQQKLAEQLGTSPVSGNCTTSHSVWLIKSSLTSSNAVKLTFADNNIEAYYYLYPTKGEENALNGDFGVTAITSTGNYELNSLFNRHGFDKLSQSYANRNTTILSFDGTLSSVPKRFSYFISTYYGESDYNFMEKDNKEYLNGIGCSEFIPMATEAVTMAEQLNIKFGHPYFEKFLTNVLNYQNSVNFDFKNYNSALVSCGLTDSIIIQKNIAHFRIKFPSTSDIDDIQDYIDTLRVYDTVGIGISDVKAYNLGGDYLLLNIYESNGRNIKEIREIVEMLLPSGSVVEYMPFLHKDTVAQLFVYDVEVMDPMPFKWSLEAAFPDAHIDFMPVDVYNFIPGYGKVMLHGHCFTIDTNISSNYDYNHYVDSIYRFMTVNAPMTTIFNHAESGVSTQYYDWQMTAWRDYVNGLPSDNHNKNVKMSKANKFKLLSASGGGYSFAASSFSYKNSKSPYYLNNLYIDHTPTSNSNYSYINTLLQTLQGTNGTILKPHAGGPYIMTFGGGNTETRAYVCGDTTQFWINHFDVNEKMTNIFIKLPDYLVLPREEYELVSVTKGVEKDSSTYINLVMGGQYGSITDTIYCIGYTNRKLGEIYTIPSAYLSSHSQFQSLSGKFENCETRKMQEIYPIARIKYGLYRDSLHGMITTKFRQHIIDSLQEQLSIKGNDIKHGLTLYYYDMAGNLVMTVPPEGVRDLDVSTQAVNDGIDNARAAMYAPPPSSGGSGTVSTGTTGTTTLYVPDHEKETKYQYNAQNKVRVTSTPDAGVVTNFYDLAGRIIISQDARQKAMSPVKCTYFIYDNLSRVIETGMVTKISTWTQEYFRDSAHSATFPSQVKIYPRSEVTATMYDTASYKTSWTAFLKLPPTQDNLKNRISCVKYFEALSANINGVSDTSYTNALHYSYDISGNVKTLIHDLRGTPDALLRFKRVDYEYDLYSGKVIMLSYNRGMADQFYQKYTYDSDNRIVDAQTSNNGIYWDRDASYQYYEHGPLARMDIGEQRVQGVDYAYTINGWLKAINGIQNNPLNDMGADGSSGYVTPKDVFSQRIDYFTGAHKDYKAIGDSTFLRILGGTSKSLFNGNIAGISVALAPFDNIYNKYHYDPLQRIDRANYDSYTVSNGSTPSATATALASGAYNSDYRYDMDGNLLTLKRIGGPVPASMNGGTAVSTHAMDDLKYHYTNGTNRLQSLADLETTTSYKIDVKNITVDTGAHRYQYDANGNMIKDVVADITNIEWNKLGKVKSVSRLDGSKLFFSYDPLGNRLTKEVVKYPNADSMVKKKTMYIRDAAGNILAVYEDQKSYSVSNITWGVVKANPAPGGIGPVTTPFGTAVADILYAAYVDDPGNNLAKLAMTIPDINGYVQNAGLLQGLVNSLSQAQGLSFLKSIPDITAFTLEPPEGPTVMPEKLSAYLQPVLLSAGLEPLQTDLFAALKTHNDPLYNATVSTIPATTEEKNEFPANTAMLTAFRGMEPGDKLTITNNLAQSLAMENIATLPHIADILVSAYSSSNSYGSFVTELAGGGEVILDQLKQDALNYIAYRYTQADMENVSLQSVQDQFKTNTVLTDVITAGASEPDPEVLSAILTTNFADLVTLADNTGKGDALVTAIKGVITIKGNVNDVAIAYPWLVSTSVLASHKQHLGEHHIYGSSRIGIQQYLPDEVKYHWAKGVNGADSTSNLNTTKPWYSLYGNDLFRPTLYYNTLNTSNMSSAGMGINSHLLGNRHYELTNHLGNVQATVLDRATPVLNTADSALLGYRSDISLAHDYYPFGMLMPGRYTADESVGCVTINTTVLVPHIVRVDLWQTTGTTYVNGDPNTLPVHNIPWATAAADVQPYVYHYNDPSSHPNGEVLTGAMVEGQPEYTISLSDEPSGGVSLFMPIHADSSQETQEVGFVLTLPAGTEADYRVRQYTGTGEEYVEAMGWSTITESATITLLVPVNHAAVAAGGKTFLEVGFRTTAGGNFTTHIGAAIKNYYTYISHYEPQTRVATICDEKDAYRFGFNGQEKDNEAKGLGNSLDFSFRIYDSRLGRFMSVDPLARKYPAYTPYGFAQNSPISGIDLEGLEYLGHNEARVEFKYGELRLKVENFHNVNRNRWNNANNDPKNWKSGEIGLSRTVSNVSFIAPQPSSPSVSDMTEVGSAKPVERYQSNIAANKYDQRPGVVGPAGKGVAFTKSIIAVDAINQVLDGYVKWAGKDDADLVQKHSIIANKVATDMVKALDNGMIPEKYMNKEGITNIMNVVLQGENNTSDPEVYKVGMQVYDMANPKTSEYVPSGMDNFPGRVVPIQQPATGN